MGCDDADRTRSLGEAVPARGGRHAGRPATGEGGSAPRPDSVVALTCVVERTQALVRQLEAELQSERALMVARLERLVEENRRLQERLRERQGGEAAAAAPPPHPGRVSPFRRGLRGL